MGIKNRIDDRRILMGWKPIYDEDRKSGKDTDVPDYGALSSDFPLDILRGHRKITGKQYDAGKLFGERYARFKWPHASGSGWAKQVKSEYPEGSDLPVTRVYMGGDRDDMIAEANFAAMVAALDRFPEARDLIRRYAALYEHDYYILGVYNSERSGNAALRRTSLICKALDALAAVERVGCDEDEVIHNALRISNRREPAPRVA